MAGFKRRYDDGAVPKPERFASGKKTTRDHRGNLTTFDASIVKQNNANKRTETPKILKKDDDDAKQKEIEKTRLETTKALMGHLNKNQSQDSSMSMIRYKHSGPGAIIMQRMIRMVETPADPLEPPKFKHKRLPRGGYCPPHVPVMHSPPRPLTIEDQNDWKVPPCISNWKNPKGYTIPLDKRPLAAAGRELVQVSHKFAHLSESLYVAEQHARDDTCMRSKVRKETMLKDTEKKDQQLLAIAKKTLSERTITGQRNNNNNKHCDLREDQCIQGDKIRKESSKERRLGKKPKLARDRDVSEKVALGMASLSGGGGQIIMYDQRLFNQEKGMDSGFGDDDDQYSVYDKALFTAQPACLSTLYKDDGIINIADEDIIKIRETDRFTCAAAAAAGVEFEGEDADPFGLDQFITQVKGIRNRP